MGHIKVVQGMNPWQKMNDNMKSTKMNAPKPLKSLNVETSPAIKAPGDTAPEKVTFELPGSEVKDYNHAAAQEKAWKKIKEEKKPSLESDALEVLYDHNTQNQDNPVKTVCLVDSTGAACNVSLRDTYDKTNHDPEQVIKGLFELGQNDPNKFVAEKLVIGFDTDFFYDESGNLRREFYHEMLAACRDVAERHGLPSPLHSTKAVTVKPGFSELRWKVFTKDQQPRVSRLFPATVSLTPLAPEKKPKV